MTNIQNILTENLDIWTSAVQTKNGVGRGSNKKFNLYGIKKIRELILELAVRGKLVPQNENDEPASVLLERIAAEKERLIKEEKIKKPKKLPEIDEDDLPFELPMGWRWTRLGKIGNIFNGNSVNARLKAEKYSGGKGSPYIATKDVGYGFNSFNYDNGVVIPKGEPKFKVAQEDAVLICSEGGSAGKKCGITDRDICFGNKLFANELLCNIPSKFILALYLSPMFYKQFVESMTGIIGGISSTRFMELLTPLPPLTEQNRIVAKVDELMALCDQLEQQTEDSITAHKTLVETLLATLTKSTNIEDLTQNWNRISEHFETLFTTEDSIDQLKQTILQLAVMGKLVPQDPEGEPASVLIKKIQAKKEKLFEEKLIKKQKPLPEISEEEKPFILPDGWEWVQCQDICYKITDGEHKTPRRSDSGHYLLSARNVTNEGILLDDVDFVPKNEFVRIRKRCDPNIGDILISCSGSVGRIALVDRENVYTMVRSAAMIRPDNDLLCKEYIAFALRSPYLQKQIVHRSRKSAQANLFLGAISKLVVLIPPLSEQHRIVTKVDQLMSLCNKLKSKITQSQIDCNIMLTATIANLTNKGPKTKPSKSKQKSKSEKKEPSKKKQFGSKP